MQFVNFESKLSFLIIYNSQMCASFYENGIHVFRRTAFWNIVKVIMWNCTSVEQCFSRGKRSALVQTKTSLEKILKRRS